MVLRSTLSQDFPNLVFTRFTRLTTAQRVSSPHVDGEIQSVIFYQIDVLLLVTSLNTRQTMIDCGTITTSNSYSHGLNSIKSHQIHTKSHTYTAAMFFLFLFFLFQISCFPLFFLAVYLFVVVASISAYTHSPILLIVVYALTHTQKPRKVAVALPVSVFEETRQDLDPSYPTSTPTSIISCESRISSKGGFLGLSERPRRGKKSY